MLFSTVFDYINGILIEKYDEKPAVKRAVLVCSVIGNLLILGFFKYSDFFIAQLNNITDINIPLLNLPLPIGISFYTFQTMSYTIDVYRKKAPVQRNIISFGAYVVMFPQLIAGPIVQFNIISHDLIHRTHTTEMFSKGAYKFIAGLAKKVLLANSIGALWSQIQEMPLENIPALTAWLGIIAFAFQIYFDFSGYSDMAVGLGMMFGFNFPENFDYPYISRSVTEFWRRWHMTLSTWFREYVYIPLGGNRSGKTRLIFNLLVVWALTGFWHGASWNFMLWGVYYAIIIILEKFFLLKLLKKIPSFISFLYTVIITIFGWVLFAFEDIKNAFIFLSKMFRVNTVLLDIQSKYILFTHAILFLLLILGSTPLPKRLMFKIDQSFPAVKPILAVMAFLLSIAYLVDSAYNPFLYFRF